MTNLYGGNMTETQRNKVVSRKSFCYFKGLVNVS